MSEEFQRLTDDIIDYTRLIIVAMVMIAVVYLVAQSLIGSLPATISSIGLAFVYIYATNKTVRQAVNSWTKNYKERK